MPLRKFSGFFVKENDVKFRMLYVEERLKPTMALCHSGVATCKVTGKAKMTTRKDHADIGH